MSDDLIWILKELSVSEPKNIFELSSNLRGLASFATISTKQIDLFSKFTNISRLIEKLYCKVINLEEFAISLKESLTEIQQLIVSSDNTSRELVEWLKQAFTLINQAIGLEFHNLNLQDYNELNQMIKHTYHEISKIENSETTLHVR